MQNMEWVPDLHKKPQKPVKPTYSDTDFAPVS